MASKLRSARVTLANLRPAPGSQQNVRTSFPPALLESYAAYSKNASVVVKALDMVGPQVVAPKVRKLVQVQELGHHSRVVRRLLRSFSQNVDS